MIEPGVITAALALGAAGSLHCVGMCGPLMLALPAATGRPHLPAAMPILYHAGRIAIYAVIGLIFGLAGSSVRFVGGQQMLSLIAGGLLLLVLVTPPQWRNRISLHPYVRAVWTRLHGMWAKAARAGGPGWFAMGALNGLLPCGLVYAAAAGAAATGSAVSGAAFMAAFGLGNAPLLVALSTAGSRIPKLRAVSHRVVPFAALTVATLLILRGLALDIPYLSPKLTAGKPSCCASP